MKDCSLHTQHQNGYINWSVYLFAPIQYSAEQQEFICYLSCHVRSRFTDAAMIIVHRSNFHCFPGGVIFLQDYSIWGLECTCQKWFIAFELIKYYKQETARPVVQEYEARCWVSHCLHGCNSQNMLGTSETQEDRDLIL